MTDPLYHFFQHPDFKKCFFTGKKVSEEERLQIFEPWIIERYQLHGKYMAMLGGNRVKYEELTVPCSAAAKEKLFILENTIKSAFEGGYPSVKELDEKTLFLWMSKMLLCILFHDILYGKQQAASRNKNFDLSALLTRKFTDLHLMMQSLFVPLEWTSTPWTIIIKKVNYSKDLFHFRDETKNLNFSLGMNGFGIVACLQDQHANFSYHQDTLEKINATPLHPIQFEELCARVIYSNYLMKETEGWYLREENGTFWMSPKTPPDELRFNDWDDKMYASVLAEYWKPWGLEAKDIYTFPDSPISFLINETTNEFIESSKITLQS